ncbi:VOC family protein [Saccharomonospora iraqiensis]|uniref:VOC family protein n=1 Tax=Saccharomonospora iraqiensis TaxID=52698 RepID=UPI00047DF462|nr:VOC family protein [Saccharomonospora iraqiensis]
MTERDISSVGAPCWVDIFQPDAAAARGFYGELFGWGFDDPVPLPTGAGDAYSAARLEGRLVAGIGQARLDGPGGWRTYVRVAGLEDTLARVESAGGVRQSGPFALAHHGRMAGVTDATGVALWLWEAGSRSHVELADEPGSWAMSALHTTDLTKAEEFYGAVFGWVLDESTDDPFAYWRLDEQVVAVAAATDGAAVPPHWSVNFAVQDADALAEQAERLGGRVLLEPFDTPGFRNTLLGDPQGGVIAASGKE